MRSKRALQTTGTGVFLAGLVTFVLSRLITDGFVHGLFQGMTIALMVGAAYLFGAQWRHGRNEGGAEQNPEALWLPSRDEDRE